MSAGSITALVETLVAAGCTPDMILAAVRTAEATKDRDQEAFEAADEERKGKARARFHKWKANKAANVSKRQPTTANVSQQLVQAHDAHDLENKQTNKEERKQDSAPVARGGLADFQAELSSILDTEHVEAICAVRRKKGATFSALAGRGLVKALRACPDITAAADEMVLRNWTGIKPDWLESRSRQNGHAPPGRSMNDVLQDIIDREKTNETIIETSFSRGDISSATSVVQFDAFATRQRP